MARRAAPFTQAQIVKAVKAARAAGMVIGSVEIDPSGKIVIASQTTEPARKALDARNVVMGRIAGMGNG